MQPGVKIGHIDGELPTASGSNSTSVSRTTPNWCCGRSDAPVPRNHSRSAGPSPPGASLIRPRFPAGCTAATSTAARLRLRASPKLRRLVHLPDLRHPGVQPKRVQQDRRVPCQPGPFPKDVQFVRGEDGGRSTRVSRGARCCGLPYLSHCVRPIESPMTTGLQANVSLDEILVTRYFFRFS